MELDGKILAILLCEETDGKRQASCHTGSIRRSGAGYEFHREDGSVSLNLTTEWLKRIQPVPDELKDVLLGAELVLSLTVGPIPDGVDSSDLVATGLKVPPHK